MALGAPGVYAAPATPRLALRTVDMHVCAFAGVAPRGPARVPLVDEQCREGNPAAGVDGPRVRSVPVAVESWDEYEQLYGGFEGTGLLPFAVSAFFQQGGARAYIVRIVHEYGDDALNAKGTAWATMEGISAGGGGAVKLLARNEGSWGNRLSATLTFQARPLDFSAATALDLRLEPGAPVATGALLRLTLAGGTRTLRFVSSAWDRPRGDRPGYERIATFEFATASAPVGVELVEATLETRDADPTFTRREVHTNLGLAAEHPRWVATVLADASSLVFPDAGWADRELRPADATLPAATTTEFVDGEDREAEIVPDDFFDSAWVVGNDCPASGIHSLVGLEDLSLFVVPDLYSPQAIPPLEDISDVSSPCGPEFVPCAPAPPSPAQTRTVPDLLGLRLDPRLPDDLAKVVDLQRRVVDLAEEMQSFVVLLDVPPRLGDRQVLAWRASFDSSFAAAYHPWLLVAPRGDQRNSLVEINPSGVAAGIIARKELAYGVPFGPANELAREVVGVIDRVSPSRHDDLHPNAINVFVPERDGVRLSAGRTLSGDRTLRQLSVRRLMTMLERVLLEEMQWTVFEPNNERLRATVTQLLTNFLRQLYRGGAFKGAEDQAFFVRCDDFLNPQYILDQGELIVEIGVCPAEPLEFLVLRLTRDGDATLRVESLRG